MLQSVTRGCAFEHRSTGRVGAARVAQSRRTPIVEPWLRLDGIVLLVAARQEEAGQFKVTRDQKAAVP